MVNLLEVTFPRLHSGAYSITSPPTKRYNCIAWAAGDDSQWWWPGPDHKIEYWPAGVSRTESLTAFRDAFATLGYVVTTDVALETGFEKVALFALESSEPCHAARQLADGKWTSKVGVLEDIEHELRDLEGGAYGTAVLILKRPRINRAS